jgi:hypothetical protein
MKMSKMLFVQSNDYWGYDASSFDDAINFYKFTWVVPESQYNSMSEDDQKRLYPCALFYVAGVTDNHNFLTLKITKDSKEAKVSGMEGTKRRTRRYEIGSNAQYSVGSYSLQAAPSSATNLEEIKEAVESGSTSEGSFLVSGFLDDAASVAAAVNYEEEKSAESFSAPITEPSGSSYEPADPTVANPSTEGPSESELITMSAEIEYAELGDESYPIVPNTTGQDSSFNGHGVPQWYGAEGSGEIDHDRIDTYEETEVHFRHDNPMTTYNWTTSKEDLTEDEEDMVDDEVRWDIGSEPSEGDDSDSIDVDGVGTVDYDRDTDYGDKRFYGLAAEEFVMDAEGLAFKTAGTLSYNTSFTRRITGDQKIKQDYKVDYEVISGNEQYSELTNEHRLTFRNMIEKDIGEQVEKEGLVDITDEEYLNGEIEYTGNNGQEVSIFYEATLMPSKVKSETISDDDTEVYYEDFLDFDAEGDSRLRDIRGKFMNRRKAKNAVFGEVMSQQMGGYYRTGIVGNNPPVGQDISRRNPVAKAKYFVQPGVQNANSGAWSKGPNFQQARKIAKGVAWDTVQDMGLAAESFASETFCADCGTTKKYRGEEEGCGCGSMSAEMEYAELGEELYPVVPNSEGGNTALDSGYGVPQWYGSAEADLFGSQSITETLEEASPAKGTLVAPALAALAGIVAGVFYARRK